MRWGVLPLMVGALALQLQVNHNIAYVRAGEKATFCAFLVNEGPTSTVTVSLTMSGVEVVHPVKVVELGPGEIQEVCFEVMGKEPGEYRGSIVTGNASRPVALVVEGGNYSLPQDVEFWIDVVLGFTAFVLFVSFVARLVKLFVT